MSPETGIILEFYEYGEGEVHINEAGFNEALMANLDPELDAINPEAKHALDCMRDYFVTQRRAEGRRLPIVIVSQPACLQNMKIEMDNCGNSSSHGFKMPHTDLNFLWFDLTGPNDEFIILTSGSDSGAASDFKNFKRAGHEIGHFLTEVSQEENYRVRVNPEEKWVEYMTQLFLQRYDRFPARSLKQSVEQKNVPFLYSISNG